MSNCLWSTRAFLVPRTAKEALDRVGLADRRHHWPNQLSGGEQQRVIMARATASDPALILADEPTGSLDSNTSDEILSLFDDFHRDGHTIIVVTRAIEVADRAQRKITLLGGRILEDTGGSGRSSRLKAITLDLSPNEFSGEPANRRTSASCEQPVEPP